MPCIVAVFSDRNGRRQRLYRDVVGKLVRPRAGIYDPHFIEGEVLHGDLHGAREAGGVGSLEFHTDETAARLHDEIELAAAVHSVEPSSIGFVGAENFLKSKAFPRGAEFRMGAECGMVRDSGQCVKNSRVTEVDARCFDEAFACPASDGMT